MWMTSCTGSTRGWFGEIWKKAVIWELDTEREGSTFGTSRGQTNLRATGAARDAGGGSRWKSQNRKNIYHSSYVEEPLNSKVIKNFVPELKSHKCFSCFGISMFYVYMLWTFSVRFTHSRIWLWYTHTHTHTYIYIYIYIYKEGLALNKSQGLICHKTQTNQNIANT